MDDHTDEEIVSIVRRDLKQMMTFKGDPEFTIVNRLPKSMPQYHVGHIKQIRKIQEHIKRTYPRLKITGRHLKRLAYLIVSNKVIMRLMKC